MNISDTNQTSLPEAIRLYLTDVIKSESDHLRVTHSLGIKLISLFWRKFNFFVRSMKANTVQHSDYEVAVKTSFSYK